MTSLYWDDFERRITETVQSIKNETVPIIRRVAVFVTSRCNFKCGYCNSKNINTSLSKDKFIEIVEKYGDTAIIHITGGEPSIVKWLYPYLVENGDKYRFHLNTNAYIMPPASSVKRLKISLDSHDATSWDCLVGHSGAFAAVVDNIKKSIAQTVVSITYTITKQNYRGCLDFVRFANHNFIGLYAIFFSVYKGTDPHYVLSNEDADIFFSIVLPQLEKELPCESLSLLRETLDDKIRIMQGVRFPSNNNETPCYLSMSEKVISPIGEEYTCSHLYRDGILQNAYNKHEKCLYGCNRRLTKFNEEVESLLITEVADYAMIKCQGMKEMSERCQQPECKIVKDEK